MMVEIHPSVQNVYPCPLCRRLLEPAAFIINGMRNLVDASCPACRRAFYVDMPADQALYTPVAIDKATREVFDPTGTAWFSRLLVESLDRRSDVPVPVHTTVDRDADEVVLINCLDYIYGHALEKLSNVLHYIDHCPRLGVWVLVPRQLGHLLPRGVAEAWEVDLPLRRFSLWHTDLEQRIRQRAQQKRKVLLAITYPQPHPASYDLDRLLGQPAPRSRLDLGRPVVVFAYREDRHWGPSLQAQKRNVEQLCQALARAYPSLSFVVVGFGRGVAFDRAILDWRVTRFDPDTERDWLYVLRRADCAIGVHGSNMHLPSHLAKHTVELMPVDRLGNFLQDIQVPASIEPLHALHRYRMIYGNVALDDISPQLVAAVAQSQLDLDDWFHLLNDAANQPRRAEPSPDDDLLAWIEDLRRRRREIKPATPLPEVPPQQPPPAPVGLFRRALRRLLGA